MRPVEASTGESDNGISKPENERTCFVKNRNRMELGRPL